VSLGVIVHMTETDDRARGSWGWSGAFGSHLVIDPANQLTTVLMINRSNIGGADSEVSRRVERESSTLTRTPRPIAADGPLDTTRGVTSNTPQGMGENRPQGGRRAGHLKKTIDDRSSWSSDPGEAARDDCQLVTCGALAGTVSAFRQPADGDAT
jgi:hypothetical protein